MAALEGFDLSISGDDVVIALGLYNEAACAAVTLDLSVLGFDDGSVDVVVDGTTVSGIESAVGPTGTEVKLGSFTSTSDVASALSLAGRGDVVSASA